MSSPGSSPKSPTRPCPPPPSTKYKKSRATNPPKKKNLIARPANCFILFRKHFLSERKGDPSKKYHPREVANIWRTLHDSERLKWQKEAERVRIEHAIRYPGYTFKPNRRPREKRKLVKQEDIECPDVAGPSHNRDATPPPASFPDFPPQLMRSRDLRYPPHCDGSIFPPMDQALYAAPQFQGQTYGVPHLLHHRSSSAPILAEGSAVYSTETLTDFAPGSLNRLGASLSFGYSSHPGIRPRSSPAEFVYPPHDVLAQHLTQTTIKQEEVDDSHILNRDQSIFDSGLSGASQLYMEPASQWVDGSLHVPYAPLAQQHPKVEDTGLEGGIASHPYIHPTSRWAESSHHALSPPPAQQYVKVEDTGLERRFVSHVAEGFPSHYPLKQEQEQHHILPDMAPVPELFPQDLHDSLGSLSPRFNSGGNCDIPNDTDLSIPQSWYPDGVSGPVKLSDRELSFLSETWLSHEGHSDLKE